ncbi:MAG: LPS export ABC transporter ATP-binding protein [Chlamydiota bacterium]
MQSTQEKAPSPQEAQGRALAAHDTQETALTRTDNLVKIYGGRAVVNGVNVTVNRGEIVGLLGPNGAGKTTTFYMIVGLIRPHSGTVYFKDRDITGMPMAQRARLGISYLSQESSIFRKLTVEQNIMAILETIPLSRAQRRARLEELLNELGIAHLAKQKAFTLSGGERRRLEISRALVTSPSFMLLDEPFSGVDPIAVFDVQQIIANLKKKGLGILLTDHSVRETLTITDRSYLIYEGKVLTHGTSDFLINDPEARQFYLGERFEM